MGRQYDWMSQQHKAHESRQPTVKIVLYHERRLFLEDRPRHLRIYLTWMHSYDGFNKMSAEKLYAWKSFFYSRYILFLLIDIWFTP